MIVMVHAAAFRCPHEDVQVLGIRVLAVLQDGLTTSVNKISVEFNPLK